MKNKFKNICILGIIGCIDCTQIAIQAPPTEDDQFPGLLFSNRKVFYSIKIQIVCGGDLKILAINPRYPGSVHYSAIWSTSIIRTHLMENFLNGDHSSWLVGDSGYPLEPWLMNPITGHGLNDIELRFNTQLRSIRNIIERVIGILKTRCRHHTMHYNPIRAAKIICACAILHNIFIEQRDMLEEEDYNDDNHEAEHFTQKVMDERKQLLPILIKAKEDGKKAYLKQNKIVISNNECTLPMIKQATNNSNMAKDNPMEIEENAEIKIVAGPSKEQDNIRNVSQQSYQKTRYNTRPSNKS
ncbi:hypothetical protein NQ314_008817 [Rhamnusium bicolor]|uniref:DDE Tnp4 domain-containing protein n=1 Tax=Rhamnusium bicolor TaxID=1586634 RepID=A0AAV8Y6D3_9CUCU|nr:hypothetical protein NQ314_008817 [Rhamnusium bicolor]